MFPFTHILFLNNLAGDYFYYLMKVKGRKAWDYHKNANTLYSTKIKLIKLVGIRR